VDGVAFFPKDANIASAVPPAPTVRQEGTQLVIGGAGTAQGQLSAPANVRTDTQGNLYVADSKNNRINKYDSSGNFVASAGGFSQSGGAQLNEPWSMAVASDGTVFVADTWAHNIVKLDKDLKQVATWGAPCTTVPDCDGTHLFGPRDIALTPDGNLLVTDTGNERVIEYSADGQFIAQFGTRYDPKSGQAPGPLELQEPVGLAVAPNGDVYLADYWNKRILHVNKDFQPAGPAIPVPSWGSNAVTDRPYLALLLNGRLLATDPANGKVLIFKPDGTPAGEYAVPGENNGSPKPVGVTSDNVSVFVADASAGVVRKIPLAEVTGP
jgi:sugar lactone lactonase YvrE